MEQKAGRQVFCEVCKVFIPSVALLAAHNKGKKHVRLVQLAQHREDSAKRSAFVTGFVNSGSLEKDLSEYFSKYGDVANIFVDKEKGKFAIVEFKCAESVQTVLSQDQLPLLDGRQIKAKERKITKMPQHQEQEHAKSQNYSKTKKDKTQTTNQLASFLTDDLEEQISKLTTISEQMKALTTALELTEDDKKLRLLICQLLEQVLEEVFGQAQVVSFGSSGNNFGLKGSDLDLCLLIETPTSIEDTNPEKLSQHEKMQTLQCEEADSISSEQGQMTKNNIQEKCETNKEELCANASMAAQNTSSNGTGSIDGSLDHVQHFASQHQRELESSSKECALSEGVPKHGSVSQVHDKKDAFSVVVEVLRRLVPGCGHIVPLLSARCPVIKFVHQTSGLHCDLSINNRLGVENTTLLRQYAKIDSRVRPLVYTIRAWSKAKGLSGRGGGQLSNYALTLMILYFLQRMTPPVVPCLQDLASWPVGVGDSHVLCSSETTAGAGEKNQASVEMTELTVAEWDCSYAADISNLPKSQNLKSEGELLLEFFKFYSNDFDYGNCAVSPCSGRRTLKQSVMEELLQLGEDVASCFKVSPLCVQDPFELNHNVAQNITEIGLKRFIQECMDARRGVENMHRSGSSQSKEQKCKGLLKLFTVSKKQKQHSSYSFYVPFPTDCLPKEGESAQTNQNVDGPMKVFEVLQSILVNDLEIVCSSHKEHLHKTTSGLVVENRDNSTTCSFPFVDKSENQLGGLKRKHSIDNCSVGTQSLVGSGDSCTPQEDRLTEVTAGLKRKCSTEEDSTETQTKRLRSSDSVCSSSSSTAFTIHTDSTGNNLELTCTAWQNKWVGRRKQRRHQGESSEHTSEENVLKGLVDKNKNIAGSKSDDVKHPHGFVPVHVGGASHSDTVEPILEFQLYLSNTPSMKCEKGSSSDGCYVNLGLVSCTDVNIFSTFYAFFKKELLEKIVRKPQCFNFMQ